MKEIAKEEQVFFPPEEFKKNAWVKDESVYKEGEDYESFWEKRAEEMIDWYKKWDKVLVKNPPYYKWFLNGKLNASYNCLDRIIEKGKGDKIAYIWEGELGEVKKLTYKQLHEEVCKFANALKKMGVKKGDIVTIYLPMIPELPIAMLACARIGAPHSVVFAGFSAGSLRDRIVDASSKYVITCDGYYRRGKLLDHKKKTDEGIEGIDVKCIVVKRGGNEVEMKEGRDYWWHDLVKDAPAECEPEVMDAEDLLFLMYTSGTTGKPKGVMHTTGGYLVGATTTMKWVFDVKDDDIYWCTADIGWITGHSYIVYGPLALGVTSIMYEGTPDYPQPDRWWEIVEKYGVTIFYTAPTAIRMCMKWGEKWIEKHNISSLRLLGTVGEPINPEAWLWYYEHVGKKRCPIVDTWWMTETGMQIITPLPAEVESALVDHSSVAESAVVGIPHEIKGQVPFAYVVLKEGYSPSEELKKELINHVTKIIGPTARPADILFVHDLPKTRSGKIMRRILRNLASGEKEVGDVTTLRNPEVVDEIKQKLEG
ncbi:hypothetical protein B6U81_06690 [Thermoplasmatales archaeon ex4484_30]|nr:MAG: hypothetical protein B6U81_06690 [Thermoplasmatales archaeon ex4484_30]